MYTSFSDWSLALESGELHIAQSGNLRVNEGSMVSTEYSSVELKPFNDTFSRLPTTIFSVMTALSIKHKSINLGQGASI